MTEQERLIETLRLHLPPQVQAAAIFEATAASRDVNLLLIADEGLSGLRAQALFAPVGRELGRRIVVHLCTAAEWAERLPSGDAFVQEILSGHVQAIRGEPQGEADDSVDARLKCLQSPLFKRLARALEQSVPETKGFGRFRDRK